MRTMDKISLALIFGIGFVGLFTLTCSATSYAVGDNSGWDISTDLDTWTSDKNFVVGDVLLFQYSSSNSVNEVTKQSYDACNTTNVLRTYSNGNSTVTLSRPGAWYFISGNKLYCLGGMKMEVNVKNNQTISPATAPAAQPGGANYPRQPSSKNDNPVPTSAAIVFCPNALFSFVAALFWLVG